MIYGPLSNTYVRTSVRMTTYILYVPTLRTSYALERQQRRSRISASSSATYRMYHRRNLLDHFRPKLSYGRPDERVKREGPQSLASLEPSKKGGCKSRMASAPADGPEAGATDLSKVRLPLLKCHSKGEPEEDETLAEREEAG